MLRVVLSGVESVGKSWLAPRLAERFTGTWVPEYGRGYTEALDRPLTLADHHAIAEGHRRAAEKAASGHPPLIVEDTDIVMTSAWARMLFGARDPQLSAIPSLANCHLLLMPDVPFVADPVRMFGAPDARTRFHAMIEAEFHDRGIAPIRISGDFPTREQAAIAVLAAGLA